MMTSTMIPGMSSADLIRDYPSQVMYVEVASDLTFRATARVTNESGWAMMHETESLSLDGAVRFIAGKAGLSFAVLWTEYELGTWVVRSCDGTEIGKVVTALTPIPATDHEYFVQHGHGRP